MLPTQIDQWTLETLPLLNRAIMAGELPAGALLHEFSRLLEEFPAPDALDSDEAKKVLVHFGLAGASVARHYQEQDISRKATPERAFDGLVVGAWRIPFQEYFAWAANASGTGHPHRDAYASLVRWNAPTTEVVWNGTRIAVIPGVFEDGLIRTYTGDHGEYLFFELLKRSEALELAVNDLIEPISSGALEVTSPEAVRRIRTATDLMVSLRKINSDFAAGSEGGLTPDHFLDVFRQFAVHWEPGDIPPSGAQDAEFLKRDFLLGIQFPDYELLVRRIFPALLASERRVLTTLIGRRPLPELVIAAVGIDPAALAGASPAALVDLVRAHPVLPACFLLMQANARFAGTHLGLANKYLFRAQDRRDAAGIPDNALVSNRKGTTGMTENLLGRLAQARRHHPLLPLRQVAADELERATGLPSTPSLRGRDLDQLVHFTDRGSVSTIDRRGGTRHVAPRAGG